MKSMRTTLALVASALLAAAFFAGSAQACSYPEGDQVFSGWGDPRSYVLAPDGDFAADGAGWTLTDGAAVASQSLALPAGSSALSPSICISRDTPFLRSMARDSGIPGAKLQVEIVYEELDESRGRVVARDKQEDWDPTQPLGQNFGLVTLDGGDSSVRVRFTAVGGDWQVDDIYIDPFARH
jgi:hypothetical protein